ncbi:MAG TPA: septal ring lytic transglycosylase RlpA family protein [Kofleriaceae bacterium]|nr:septal ring lytic transglycosylase RlpA family protein [Kofleriaceae bacterium]
MRQVAAVALLLLVVAGCTARTARRERAVPETREEEVVKVLRGRATYYGDKFHGRKTASGERFSQHKMTAAHRSLPFGTMVRVTNLSNGKSVVVRINDRGPWGRDRRRIIDLSKRAARALDFMRAGWTRVKVEVLK